MTAGTEKENVMRKKIYEIDRGPQYYGPRELETGVNFRLPKPVRWSQRTRSLWSGVPPEDLPTLTGADINWRGIDQELGDETTLTVAVAVLIGEMAEEMESKA